MPSTQIETAAKGLHRYVGFRQTIIFVGALIGIAAAWYLRTKGAFDPTEFQRFVGAHSFAAPLVAILIYALAGLSGLPTLPLNLAAGVFWGPVIGGLISTVATTLGAVAAFAVARSIFGRPLARRFDNKVITRFQCEFEKKGWRFLSFIRLNPIFPTGPLNYILGLTGVDAFTYTWATFVFILPPALSVAFIGDSVGSFVVEGNSAHLVALVTASSFGLSALAGLAYLAHLLCERRNSD